MTKLTPEQVDERIHELLRTSRPAVWYGGLRLAIDSDEDPVTRVAIDGKLSLEQLQAIVANSGGEEELLGAAGQGGGTQDRSVEPIAEPAQPSCDPSTLIALRRARARGKQRGGRRSPLVVGTLAQPAGGHTDRSLDPIAEPVQSSRSAGRITTVDRGADRRACAIVARRREKSPGEPG